MKSFLGSALLMTAMLYAADTPQKIYDTGIRQTAAGNLAEARNTLSEILDAYPHDALAVDARGAIDATMLFEEGQARAKAGRYETARVAFETLVAVYPENPLVPRAKAGIAALPAKKQPRPVVQALEFRDVDAVPADDIRAEQDAREVRLSVGQTCRAKDVEQAKTVLGEILAEKGITHVRIEAQTRTLSPNAVAVVFTVEKPRASLLTPWRMLHRTQSSGI
jgi:outer membrane protein assembly factor BamD (BamD/ComL family)